MSMKKINEFEMDMEMKMENYGWVYSRSKMPEKDIDESLVWERTVLVLVYVQDYLT